MAIPNRGEFPVPPPMKNIKEPTTRANFFEKVNDGEHFDRAAVHASHLFQAFQYFPDYVNLFMTPGRDLLPTDEMMAEAGETQREDYYPITRDVYKAYFDTNDVSNLSFNSHSFDADDGSHVFGGTHLLNHPFKKKTNLLSGGVGSYYPIESAQSFFYENMSPNLGYGTTEADGGEMWSPFKRQGQLSASQTRSHTILSHLGTSFFQDLNAVMGRLGGIGYEMKGGASGSGHYGYQNVHGDGGYDTPQGCDDSLSEASEVYGQKVTPQSVTVEGDVEIEDLDGNVEEDTVEGTYNASNIWADINAETDELAKELSSQGGKYFENQHGYNNKLSGAYISLFADKSTNGSLTGSFDDKGKLSALDLDNAKNMYLMAASEFESINRYQLGWFEMVGPANEAPNPYRDFGADNYDYQATDAYYDANKAYTEKYWDVFKEEHLSQLHMKNRYYLEPFVYLNHLEDNYVRKVFSVIDPETLRPYDGDDGGDSLPIAIGNTDNDEYYDYILKTMIHSSAYLGDAIKNQKQIGDKSLAGALNAMGVDTDDVLTATPHDMFTTPVNGIENVAGNYLDPEKARELYQAAMVTFRNNTGELDDREILKDYGAYITTLEADEKQLVLSEFGRKMMLDDIGQYKDESRDFLSDRYDDASWLDDGSWAWVQHISGDDLRELEDHLKSRHLNFSDDFPTATYAMSGSTDAAKTVLAALGPYVQYIMGGRHKFEQVYTDEFAGWRTNDNVSTYVDSWAFLSGTEGHRHGRKLTWAPSRHMVFLNSSDRQEPDSESGFALEQTGALMAFSNLLDDGEHLTSTARAFDDRLDLYQRKASWRHVLHTDVHLTSEDHFGHSASISMRNRMRTNRHNIRMREWTELKSQFEEAQLNEKLAQQRAQERRAEQDRFAQEAAQRREADRRRSQES